MLLAMTGLCAALLLAVHNLGAALNYHDLVHAVRGATPSAVTLAFAATLFSYVVVISGATPAFHSRLMLLQATVPLWVVEGSNFLSSV